MQGACFAALNLQLDPAGQNGGNKAADKNADQHEDQIVIQQNKNRISFSLKYMAIFISPAAD
jgi:hypothetical protein